MRISLDVDGVLADFNGQVRRLLDSPEPSHQENVGFWWPIDEGYFDSKVEFWAWADTLGPLFWFGMDPVEGALEAVLFLRRHGHHLEVITHRRPQRGENGAEPTELWLGKWFGIWSHETTFMEDGPRTKNYSKHIPDRGIDLHIDDREAVVRETVRDGTRAILLDQPWNRQDREGVVEIADSWYDIVEAL